MGYGTLEHAFWEDVDLQEIGLDGRAFAAYLLTCRHASREGYYRLPIGYVCDDLRIDADTCAAWLQIMDLKNLARYDRDSQVLFIRNSLKFHPPKGKPSVTGAMRRALDVPLNPFRGMFYDAAAQFAPEFARALQLAGWCSDDTVVAPTLFENAALAPAQRPVTEPAPGVPGPGDHVETIMRHAALLSVQQSIARREQIRNPEAVAHARLTQNRDRWIPIIEGWLTIFANVPPLDMAKALADGGTASPYWPKSVNA